MEPKRRPIRPDERELLVRFAHVDLSLDELLSRLDGMVELEFGPSQRRFTAHWLLVDPGIRIVRADIECAVAKRIDGTLSERDLVGNHASSQRRLCLGI